MTGGRHSRQTHTHCHLTRLLRLVGLLAWVVAMAYLSLVPASTIPSALPGGDKFHHFAGYAVLAWLLLWTLTARHALSIPLLTGAWIACSVYGLLLEILQGLMRSGRQFEGGDLLANALGALMVCVLFRHINERSSPHDR